MERTIPNLLADAADAAAEAPWLFFGDAVFTYEDATRRVGSMSAGLAALGVARGDLVLVPMSNTPGHLFTWLALMRLGAVLVAANPASSAAETSGLIDQTEPRLVLGGADVEGLLAADDADPPAVPGPRADDPAVLIPTSGTTGRSKLVTQTHRAYVLAGEGSPSTFLDSARRYGATEFNAIGAMLEMLMRQPPRPDDAETPLRLVYTGPAPTEARQLEIERRLGLRSTRAGSCGTTSLSRRVRSASSSSATPP